MTTKHRMKVGDLESPLRVRLLVGGVPVPNLEAATSIRFVMSSRRLGIVADGPASPVAPQSDPENVGWVEYEWVAGETDVAGDYQGEIEVKWPELRPQRFPAKGYIGVVIEKNLG